MIDQARLLLGDGASKGGAAAELAGSFPREDLELAHWLWVEHMHRRPSDDFEATRLLSLLLAALAQSSRPAA